jgi:hypothetical protein
MRFPLQHSTNKVDYFAGLGAVVRTQPIIAKAAKAASVKPFAAQAVAQSFHSVVPVVKRRAAVPM